MVSVRWLLDCLHKSYRWRALYIVFQTLCQWEDSNLLPLYYEPNTPTTKRQHEILTEIPCCSCHCCFFIIIIFIFKSHDTTSPTITCFWFHGASANVVSKGSFCNGVFILSFRSWMGRWLTNQFVCVCRVTDGWEMDGLLTAVRLAYLVKACGMYSTVYSTAES